MADLISQILGIFLGVGGSYADEYQQSGSNSSHSYTGNIDMGFFHALEDDTHRLGAYLHGAGASQSSG